MPFDTDVKGLLEAQRKLEQVIADLHGEPMRDGLRKATLLVTRDAKALTPVDTGRLMNSITPEVRAHGEVVEGVVGSNVKYAAAVELGSKPHWPPLSALEPWARRHGMTAFVVARSIAAHGTKPKRFLQKAFEQNRPEIVEIIGHAVEGIVNQ